MAGSVLCAVLTRARDDMHACRDEPDGQFRLPCLQLEAARFTPAANARHPEAAVWIADHTASAHGTRQTRSGPGAVDSMARPREGIGRDRRRRGHSTAARAVEFGGDTQVFLPTPRPLTSISVGRLPMISARRRAEPHAIVQPSVP